MNRAVFELNWRQRQGGGGKSERRYLDFVVDGQSLYDLLLLGNSVSCLGWGRAEVELQRFEQLLLRAKTELESGRVPIYICPECGDLACGAVTVRIEKGADGFVWSDFAFEDGCEETASQFEGVGPFSFNKTAYWQVLSKRKAEVIE